jgi:hypothetical protein
MRTWHQGPSLAITYCGIDRDDMFVHMILVHMVEMTIVKIVHMAIMANRGVPAFRPMATKVVRMVFSVQVAACSLLACGSPRTPRPMRESRERQRRQGRSQVKLIR